MKNAEQKQNKSNDSVNRRRVSSRSDPLGLESSRTELKGLIQDRMQSKDIMKSLEQDRIRLQTELEVVKRDLEERHRDLQKERTRVENMIRQEQVCQYRTYLLSTCMSL